MTALLVGVALAALVVTICTPGSAAVLWYLAAVACVFGSFVALPMGCVVATVTQSVFWLYAGLGGAMALVLVGSACGYIVRLLLRLDELGQP